MFPGRLAAPRFIQCACLHPSVPAPLCACTSACRLRCWLPPAVPPKEPSRPRALASPVVIPVVPHLTHHHPPGVFGVVLATDGQDFAGAPSDWVYVYFPGTSGDSAFFENNDQILLGRSDQRPPALWQ